MTPEEKQQFEDMRNELAVFRELLDIERITDELIKTRKPESDSELQRNVSIVVGDGSTTIQVLDYPDSFFEFRYKGTLYRIPLYDQERFT